MEKVEAAHANAEILEMTDRGESMGWAAVALDGDVLRIIKLTAGEYNFSDKPDMEQTFILDTLVRSAASYGETFGADSIETAFTDFYGFFKARGFECDDTHAFTPMTTIVRYE